MPLTFLNHGDRARVRTVMGVDAVRKHLGSLGVIPGAIIEVMQVVSGNIILGINDSRIGVNEDLAKRVMVDPIA